MKEAIRLKGVVAEDLINYKKPSMFLITSFCNWKCCKGNPSICQNNSLSTQPIKEIDIDNLIKLYTGIPVNLAVRVINAIISPLHYPTTRYFDNFQQD